jgi:hypothetical protein
MLRRLGLLVLLACGPRALPPPGEHDGGHDVPDAGQSADSGTPSPDAGTVEDAGIDEDAGTTAADAGQGPDSDGDGLSDAVEADLAQRFLPNLSLHPQDTCPLGGIVYRARPHPMDSSLVLVFYDHLYERDCGIGSHTGDAESFSITVSLAKNAVTAVKAISHRGTTCEKITSCGTCGTLAACDLAPSGKPRVYASRGKHGTYVQKSACSVFSLCPDDCAEGDQQGVPLINLGEPSAHLVGDLTDAGFITTANGWTKTELFHYDPWGPEKFSGGGRVSEDLVDPMFDAQACQ